MSLGVFTPMFKCAQKLRIKACQASQILGVSLIRFAFVGIDEPQFASIGHQDLVAALLEQTAYPGRVGTGLYSYTERLLTSEAPPQSLRGSTQPTFLHHLAIRLVEEAKG
jgi:hypothetical protein